MACLRVGERDLAHLGGELVEEANIVAQLDRGRLRPRERIPARERRVRVKELLRPLLALEDQVVGVEEQLGRVGRALRLARRKPTG